ncbi:MAG: hypothetical protein DRH12_16755 [Deltaproteobacteria bacterium]|nr:MAG: hypothetical protein DRH12_16755 [Deltaproteobacteria bacterium]
MNPITFPLRLRMRGKKVADLQDTLSYLLENRRELLAPLHAPRPPDWDRIAIALRIERNKQYYGKATRDLVANLQQNLRLRSTGEVDKKAAEAINTLLCKLRVLEDTGEKPTFVVRGRVVSHELRGLPGLHVIVVDKNVGEDVQLGKATTGESGAYEMRYYPKKIRKGKGKPDLQVQVLNQESKILAASEVRYNAGPEEWGLDIVVPEGRLPRPAEFRRLLEELSPQLNTQDEEQLKRRLAELKEDDERQDITYLANKTGWDARMVAMTALASRFGGRTGIEPAFYYALFRAGVPADEAVLSQMAPETVKQIWKRAVEKQILPQELERKIPESLERFKAYSAERLLEEPTRIGLSNFKDLLRDVLRDEGAQQRFARLYQERRDDLEGFWKEVRQQFGQHVAERLQLDGKLAC